MGDHEACMRTASSCGIFSQCSEKTLRSICDRATRVAFPRGHAIATEGQRQTEMVMIESGRVERHKTIDDQEHVLAVATGGSCIGANHILPRDTTSVGCTTTTPVTGFQLSADGLEEVISDRDASREVIVSLNKEIRHQAWLLQTPLLEQHAKPTPYFATSVAASLEAFFRSAMNSMLNARLTGQPVGQLFPNMTLQVPTRVVYFNGFKGLRHLLEKHVDADDYAYPQTVRLVEAVSPGIIMTPISSLLEAYNAGHMNPESLTTRWMRGLAPRCLREVIFGVGLNQLSDYFEERIPLDMSPFMKNAAASVLAGICSGYFSHVPHNLSTMKLMNPQKSYKVHIEDFIEYSKSRVPKSIPPSARYMTATVLALVFPKGMTIRTSQIVGSFIILNGTITAMHEVNLDSISKIFQR